MPDDNIPYDTIMDLNLSVDEYSEKLEVLLRENRISIVERRKITRQKVQEFKDEKRKPIGYKTPESNE